MSARAQSAETGLRDPESGEFWYLPMDVVRFGGGSLERLPTECERVGGTRVFVITVPELSAGSVMARIRGLLGDRLVGVFDGVQAHVPYPMVIEAVDAVRAADADLLVSLGGGSAIDTSRAVALAIGEGANTIEALEAFRARYDPGAGTMLPATRGRSLPHVAIPTTLAAAEFANAGAVTSLTRRVKDLLIANELTPRVVIHDPEVGVTTPADLWVSTGMRSLDHAIETVYSPRHQPVTDVLSLEAIRRLAAALPAARRDPADVGARAAGYMGAWLSYFGEMNLSLGLSHAIGHQLGPKGGYRTGSPRASSCRRSCGSWLLPPPIVSARLPRPWASTPRRWMTGQQPRPQLAPSKRSWRSSASQLDCRKSVCVANSSTRSPRGSFRT